MKLTIKNEYGYDQSLFIDGQESELSPGDSIVIEVSDSAIVEVNKRGIFVSTKEEIVLPLNRPDTTCPNCGKQGNLKACETEYACWDCGVSYVARSNGTYGR